MDRLESYLTCDYSKEPPLDKYYLRVVRGDAVIWKGIYCDGSIKADYEYDKTTKIGQYLSGDMSTLDDLTYGEWVLVLEETREVYDGFSFNLDEEC